MLNKKIIATKLQEISINFSIEIKKDYVNFIFEKLNEYNISEKRFIRTVNRILKREKTLFNKMPPLAMFINPILNNFEKLMEKIEIEEENKIFLKKTKIKELENGN